MHVLLKHEERCTSIRTYLDSRCASVAVGPGKYPDPRSDNGFRGRPTVKKRLLEDDCYEAARDVLQIHAYWVSSSSCAHDLRGGIVTEQDVGLAQESLYLYCGFS